MHLMGSGIAIFNTIGLWVQKRCPESTIAVVEHGGGNRLIAQAFFDRQGKKVQDLGQGDSPRALELAHLSAFLAAVRSRKTGDLAAEALEGHRSTACCHMANVSHRLGKTSSSEAIWSAINGNAEMADAFERCRESLRSNGVDLDATPATLGPWVSLDAERGRFVGDFADAANALSRREYRKPFVVPDLTAG